MWWLKALVIWCLISLALTGVIGRFLSGKYIQSQAKPPADPSVKAPPEKHP